VPLWPFAAAGFSVVYSKAPLAEAYRNAELVLDAQRKAANDFGWVFSPMSGYAAFGGWEFGGEIKWPSGEFAQAPTVGRYVVETPEDAMNVTMPEVKSSGMVPMMLKFYHKASQSRHDNEPFNVLSMGCGAFTVAANIAGPEKMARWLIKKPDAAHRLLRMATDYLVELSRYWKDVFGIEGVLPFGGEPTSCNALISPRHFEEYALPYIKEGQEKILAMGYKTTYMHICGDHNANLPFWAEVPFGDPGIISIGHEVALEKAAEYFPGHIILGNLDPALIQTGTPAEVYEASREVIEQGKKLAGGFVFSPGCELPPMAPVENVMAMTKAINDFGWYEG
jgi:uroporphyrinogen decarboxylase